MKFVEDLTNKEIATALGKSEGAVKTAQHRSIQNIKKIINGKYNQKIKKLKDIRPDTEYSQRSKLVILATPIASKINPAFKAIFDVIEILKKLKQIKPDAEYSRISKLAVLNSPLLPQKRSIFNWQLAFTMAGLGLVLISRRSNQ